jgi:predicted Zn-dependent peptidase
MNTIKFGSLNPSMKYIVCKTKNENHISIQIRINAGSRDEKNNIHGISHLLEHMFFQGSIKYPTQKDLESAIYECGGSFNAYTSKSSTVFYIDASKKCLEKTIDIISDAFYHSLFDETKLTNEKKVVVNEINDHLSNPSTMSWYGVDEMSFKNTRLSKDIAGSEKSVNSITVDKLKNYINTYYAKNVIISLAGNFTTEKGYQLLKKYFTKKPHYQVKKIPQIIEDKKRILYPNFNHKQKKMNLKYVHKNVEQSFITITFPSYKYSDKNKYLTSLISQLLTGYMSSKLYDVLRNKHGLVYQISSDEDIYEDLGRFHIHCSTKNNSKSINQCVHLILQVIESLKDSVTQKEVTECKKHLIESMKLNKNNAHWCATNYALDLYYLKTIRSITDEIKFIQQVSLEEIQKISSKIFQRHLMNICYTAKQNTLKI